MGTTLDSLNNIIASSQTNGAWRRFWTGDVIANTTAANSTSGNISAQRVPETITVPSVGGGLTGMYITHFRWAYSQAATSICALTYTLGSLTVSGNTFNSGIAMPTKSLRLTQASSAITTAAQIALVVVTTALTATTPVLTITYTDQAGNTGQTATLTLPTNATINSAFLIHPHLASADSGMRAVTNLSISAGSAGVLAVHGLLVLGMGVQSSGSASGSTNPLASPEAMWLCEANETIGIYHFGVTSSGRAMAMLVGVAEN